MPRLQLETYLLPDDLFQREVSDHDDERHWFVLHTRPRAEKSLARQLCELESSFFLPLHEQRTMRRGRVMSSFLPLFPGYVFIHGSEENRIQAMKTNLVVQCLRVRDQQELHQDLSNVYQLISSGECLTPEQRLEPGRPVEIIHGPFRGMEGRVIRRENRMRLQIEVRLLQRGVSVELESWMIAAMDSRCSERQLSVK